MLLKVIALAKLLAALADSEAFKALVDLLKEWAKGREPMFGATAGNSDATALKTLCMSKGVAESDCDDFCDKLTAA